MNKTSDNYAAILIALLVCNYLGWLLHVPAMLLSVVLVGILSVVGLCIAHKLYEKDYILVVFLLFAVIMIMTNPIKDWDARSIWFFHAKRLFFDNSLQARLDDYANFSHNDYPDLISSLAGTVAYTLGYWNEYLPKLALFIAAVPPALLILSFFTRNSFKVLAVGLIMFAVKDQLINGYMDGLQALYAAAALLLVQSTIEMKCKPSLLVVLLLAAVSCIKNEGFVLAILLIAGYAFSLASARVSVREWSAYSAMLCIALVPAIVWKAELYSAHIVTDLFQDGIASLAERAQNRLQNAQYFTIISYMFEPCVIFVSYLLLVMVFHRVRRELLIILTVPAYWLVLFVIYMTTYHELIEHLENSASRVIMPLMLMLYISALRVLQEEAL